MRHINIDECILRVAYKKKCALQKSGDKYVMRDDTKLEGVAKSEDSAGAMLGGRVE